MFNILSMKRTAIQFGFVLISVTSIGVSDLSAEDNLIGANEFYAYCASCHGHDASGGGPMADLLNIKPSDLTMLAKNNRGEFMAKAGQFPFQKVFQIIDGRTIVSGHGDRNMPVWGARYKAEEGEMYGPMGAERVVRARILDLVYYLQSIQK